MTLIAPRPFRVGIIGGMGPLAGVRLQQLIVEATPATRDQDHLQVMCFTNPQIPDRNTSLRSGDGGDSFVRAVLETGQALCRIGVDIIVIPCNTAHVRIPHIQAGLSVPVLNMVRVAARALVASVPVTSMVGLLATDATIAAAVYPAAAPHLRWALPGIEDQKLVMEVIYAIKAGKRAMISCDLLRVARQLIRAGATRVLLGCTELSLCDEDLRSEGILTLDPLRLVAEHLVRLRDASLAATTAAAGAASARVSSPLP